MVATGFREDAAAMNTVEEMVDRAVATGRTMMKISMRTKYWSKAVRMKAG